MHQTVLLLATTGTTEQDLFAKAIRQGAVNGNPYLVFNTNPFEETNKSPQSPE